MNLFKKALIAVLGLGLVVAPSTNRQVEAASTDVWGMIGSMNGWSPSSITSQYETTWNSSTSKHELTIALTKGDQFKFLLKGSGYAWGNKEAHARSWEDNLGTQDTDITSFFSGSSDNNFVCSVSNTYKFSIDSAASGWGDCEWGLSVEVVAEKYAVSYYDGSTLLGTEQVTKGTALTGKFYEKEGYRLEGWYTNSALTSKLSSTATVTAATSLYAKYVEAEDYKIYFEDNGTFGSTVDAYFYSDDNRNNAWPGEKMTQEENGFWSFTVDASKGYTHVIFGNGNDTLNSKWAQTANLDLAFDKEAVYTVGSKNSEKKYTATVAFVEDLEAAANLSVKYQQNGSSVRIISTLGAGEDFSVADYENVGFKFELNGVEKEVTAGYVYTSVVADGEPISAEAFGAAYFYVVTFNNVEAGATLNVTPFATLTNGFVVTGQQTTLSF